MKLKTFIASNMVILALLQSSSLKAEDKQAQVLAVLMAKIESMQKTLVPAGTVVAFTGTTAPQGWLLCDGSAKAKAAFPDLFKAIGTSHGGSGENFNIPDYRGMFLRGFDAGRGKDPDAASRLAMAPGGNTGNALGTTEDSANLVHSHGGVTGFMDSHQSHNHGTHGVTWPSEQGLVGGGVWPSPVYVTQWKTTDDTNIDHRHSIAADGRAEARPVNASVNYIIKY